MRVYCCHRGASREVTSPSTHRRPDPKSLGEGTCCLRFGPSAFLIAYTVAPDSGHPLLTAFNVAVPCQRQRQIDIGKATLGYIEYTSKVPKYAKQGRDSVGVNPHA